MQQRIQHLDVARGMGITLVVLGHNLIFQHINPMAHQVLHSINMPMFFLMSGVFFNDTLSLGKLTLAKLDGVLKPFFVTLIVVAPLQPLLSRDPFVQYVAGSLYGTGGTLRWTPLWFLPHLFLVFITARVYLNIAERLRIAQWLSLLLGVTSVTLAWEMFQQLQEMPIPLTNVAYSATPAIYSELGFPFSADLLLITVPIFLVGHALRQRLRTFEPHPVVAFLGLVAFILLHYLSSGEMNLNDRVFDDYVCNIGQTVCGVYLVLSAAVWISRHRPMLTRLLTQAAAASLFILLFHDYLQRRVFRFFMEHSHILLLAAIASWLAAMILPALAFRVVSRVPWLAVLWLPLKRVRRQREAQAASTQGMGEVVASSS
ncbi:fucose 4-O-acetylase-like acetyltransferase [Silvimonas terrae]|uniref:Fucose 4-O-acetylase-like acetyltransferase n=1 Tax=Silvimonas terrae TaxID=300266 RepID=A0A840RN99_9NEIS|nr:acyltransferase family protein [Silvimonas terrae]MBB5193551.1 fucose 4-O-acetylase-like acetyltransferase [Silvimonas terrae]